jgi:hypothetical protein
MTGRRDTTEISSYIEKAEKSHTKTPSKRPHNAGIEPEILLVFFHIKDKDMTLGRNQ